MQQFDLVICGGGMVGLAMAIAMSGQGMRIAVIERQSLRQELKQPAELRVSAINGNSQSLLRQLDVWPSIKAQRLQPYDGMDVWLSDSFGAISFDAKSLHRSELGHIVENQVIVKALHQRLQDCSDVSLFEGFEISTQQQLSQDVLINLIRLDDQSQQQLTASLVVAADGANSWQRQHAQIPVTSWDYGHHGLVATIRTELPHAGIARQVFLPDGPLAFLPLSDPYLCSIVWSLPPLLSEQKLALPAGQFNKQLSCAFDMRMGLCERVGEAQAVPLKMRYARDFARERLFLIGDAAHTIHPLAGLGVNLGLTDVQALSQHLIRLNQQGLDIGSLDRLRSVERERKAAAAKMIVSMEALKQIFVGKHPLRRLIAAGGLSMVQQVSPLKQFFIQQAMGSDSQNPVNAVNSGR